MNTPQSALDAGIERFRQVKYTEEEIAQITAFLERFCSTGILFLTELFIRARIYKHRKPLEIVLTACRKYDELVWKYSTPGRYGDPDDPTCSPPGECRGAHNAGAVARVYLDIELPFPKGIH
ncbi:MAG: hypothetical protein Q7R64_01445 [bacterium]|nr:hypothetical protein [bacterium]